MARYPDKLEEEFRRQIYTFVLSVYELSGSVKQPGVLIKDIELLSNKLLIFTAKYAVTDNALKDKVINDILGELKGLKALLGAARDIGLINRERFKPVWEESLSLEKEFSGILDSSQNYVTQNPDEPETPDKRWFGKSFDPEVLGTERLTTSSDTSGFSGNTGSGVSTLVPSGAEGSAVVSSEEILEESGIPNVLKVPKVSKVSNVSEAGSHGERRDMSLRQTAILEVLKRRNRVTVGELGALFSGRVSKKTLQRDLQDLADRSIVKRTGEKRWAVYSLNS